MAQLPVPKGPALENLFCKMIESKFIITNNAIDTAVFIPLKALRRLKGFTTRVENVILTGIIKTLEGLIALVEDLIKLDSLNSNQSIDNFCTVLFQCEAAKQLAVELGLISLADANNFDLFVTFVCSQGLGRMISRFFDQQISLIEAQLLAIKDKISNDVNIFLNTLITRYQDALEDAGILTLLDSLDAFGKCIFAACDFAESAINKREDTQDRLLLNADNTVNSEKLLEGRNEKQTEIDTKILFIETSIADLKKAGQIGIDDVMKDF